MHRSQQRLCRLPNVILTTALIAAVAVIFHGYHAAAGQKGKTAAGPVQVTIRDEKPVVVEPVLPVDPQTHITLRWGQIMDFSPFVDGKRLIYSSAGGIRTTFKIDNRYAIPGQGGIGRVLTTRAALKQRPGRKRQGWKSVYQYNNIKITQFVELIPTRLRGKNLKPGKTRRIDAVMVRYVIENNDNRAHNIGMRCALDTLLVNNDGCLWAAPNQPGKILNGVEIKKKMIPDYLQVLQIPNLQNPGYVSHWTFKLGRGREKPTRIVLTAHGQEYTQWDVRAVQARGDTGMALFWDPRQVKAKSKVEFAYAYGEGLAGSLIDGAMNIVLDGSFTPGKLFNISTYVQEPPPGQWLQLQLPEGMQLVEGKAIQPVPTPSPLEASSIVLWKARVLRPGQFTVRVRSSTGVTQTKLVTISRVPE